MNIGEGVLAMKRREKEHEAMAYTLSVMRTHMVLALAEEGNHTNADVANDAADRLREVYRAKRAELGA